MTKLLKRCVNTFTGLCIVFFLTILLSSCATSTNLEPKPELSDQYTAGKQDFLLGNYKPAFHNLLPIAQKGNAESQYAVGYMYYYGLGVPRNQESGIFWMTKSANQHYQPAQDALDKIASPEKYVELRL